MRPWKEEESEEAKEALSPTNDPFIEITREESEKYVPLLPPSLASSVGVILHANLFKENKKSERERIAAGEPHFGDFLSSGGQTNSVRSRAMEGRLRFFPGIQYGIWPTFL